MPRVFLALLLFSTALPASAAQIFAIFDAVSVGDNVLVTGQTSSTALGVLTMNASGAVINMHSFAGYEAALATNGSDTALVSSGCGRLVNGQPADCSIYVTWLDARGEPLSERALLLDTGNDFVRVDVDRTATGGFLVAGSNLNQQQIWVARLAPRAASITDRRVIAAERAEGVKLATNGNTALVAWDKVFRRCFAASGCPYADSIVHARSVDTITLTAGPMRGLSGERVKSVAPSGAGEFLVATAPFNYEYRGSFITRVTATGTTEVAALRASTLTATSSFAAWAEPGVNGDSNVYLGTGERFDRVASIASSHTVLETQPVIVPRANDAVVVFIAGSELVMRVLAPAALPPALAAPVITEVKSEHYVHVTVRWTGVPNAKLYRVIATPADGLGLVFEAPPSGPERDSVEITNLRAETPYEIRVVVEDENGRSMPSPPVFIRTDTGRAPRPAAGFRATRNANGTYTLSWRDLTERETSYEIRVESGTGAQVIEQLPSNTTEYTLPLPNGTLYEVRVRAHTPAGFDESLFLLDTSVPAERTRAVGR